MMMKLRNGLARRFLPAGLCLAALLLPGAQARKENAAKSAKKPNVL